MQRQLFERIKVLTWIIVERLDRTGSSIQCAHSILESRLGCLTPALLAAGLTRRLSLFETYRLTCCKSLVVAGLSRSGLLRSNFVHGDGGHLWLGWRVSISGHVRGELRRGWGFGTGVSISVCIGIAVLISTRR